MSCFSLRRLRVFAVRSAEGTGSEETTEGQSECSGGGGRCRRQRAAQSRSGLQRVPFDELARGYARVVAVLRRSHRGPRAGPLLRHGPLRVLRLRDAGHGERGVEAMTLVCAQWEHVGIWAGYRAWLESLVQGACI